MAAVGFFLAVYLQLQTTPSISKLSSLKVPVEDKERVLQQVADNSPQPTYLDESGAPISPSQADANDPGAEAKLKVLQALGSE